MSDTKRKLRWQYQRGRDIGSLCPSFLYRSAPCYPHRDRGSRTSISNVSPRQGTQPTHVDSSPYAYSRTRLDVAVRPSFALRTSPDEKCLGAGVERENPLPIALSALSPPHLRPSPRPCIQVASSAGLRNGRSRQIPTYSMNASTSRRHGATRAKAGRDIARDRRVAILCAHAQGGMLGGRSTVLHEKKCGLCSGILTHTPDAWTLSETRPVSQRRR
ncbi:hypothetical protein K466DRAFT_364205 [Polyporus arcularius HHB13444]|uniref:Uncharacterized protein n=1 Tax=Polyporus arcularius HHB13444 TaxID=1314778 RepID=A0A5C3NV02_9APHY|nr:hypothetical protein K466DRAFT_364205 [Polyporus arcularius HHB13444]